MAGATKTTADSALKEDYQPLVREQINNDIPLLTYVSKNTKDIEGRRAVLSLHVTRNSGIGARAENGTLPTAGSQGYAEERVSLKYNYGRGQISGPLIRSAASDRGSFERALDGENRRIVDDLKRDVNRQLWGTSDGAIISFTLSSNSTVLNVVSTASDVQIRQIEVGMPLDIGTVAAPTTNTSNNAVTSVDDSTAGAYTITVTTAMTTTAASKAFRTGNGGATTAQVEITGLQTIVSSAGTLFNVNPSTYPVWKSVIDHNTGTNRQLSENLMAKLAQNVQIKSGVWPNLFVAHHGVFRAYAALLASLKRFTNTIQLQGGYAAGLPFMAGGGKEIPVVVDRDCPANSMYLLNTDHLTEYMMSDWEFMDQDGAVLSRVSGVDGYEFILFKYAEVAPDQRASHGALLDITSA